jgi:hypothetical protein
MTNELDERFKQIISNPKNWLFFQHLYNHAAVIVSDFDEFGEVLQSNNDDNIGAYDQNSTVEQLRGALYRIDNTMMRKGDYLSYLSNEQQERLKRVAVEVIMTADGDLSPPHELAQDDVDMMTPYERLVATGYTEANDERREQLRKRLGFEPLTGESIIG